ncbi:MAG: recombinase RecX [Bacteroidetes bacterium MED-G13]|nr:MAG: recombinase RecX [Bacteroidetes bacterium MED-G13]|tara:strand:+ start:19511 stop:19978 length:468 start_codon:yes stop_codon:yes gene_type:complete
MPIKLSKDEKVILEKMRSYCMYQERSIQEVKKKLTCLQVISKTKSKIINHLIDNDYLNEVRFAKSFIQGKLRIKKWGRIKLNYELRIRGVKKFIIDEQINKISNDDYYDYFNEFSNNKIKILKGSKDQKKRSFINYFTYRGWENNLIYEKLNEIN